MAQQEKALPYQDPSLPVEERVKDLVSRMTLEEKVSQTLNASPAIERLGIPEYDWWNECLHGVARAGIATVFPQAIGLAATWNTDLMAHVAVATSDEARAKHHEALRQGEHGRYKGLTFWSPNINIFRDPRWGRGQETYGEDPYLTARMGVEFIKGLQGDNPKYLKLVATPKHYAVHSGPEHDRHHFDARASERDMRQTYLPAFKACIVEAKAYSIMGAYNRTNGEPCCASPTLLEQILREEWGFEGYVVSDCGAIADIHLHHKVVETPEAASALAVKMGCELNCGRTYGALLKAVDKGLLSEEDVDRAVERLFTARLKLGMFDPPEMVPYAQIPYSVNDSPAHRELALQAARESIVLLKNDGLLPLNRHALRSVAVIGPNADEVEVLLGNYNGTPSSAVTPRQGLAAKLGPKVEVRYAKGSGVIQGSVVDTMEAAEAAREADVVIACVGISQLLEGEEGQRMSEGISQGDRSDLDLPSVQRELLQAIHAVGKPLIVVLINGSALSVNWANKHANAIVEAWYPGEEGGTALAEVLLGEYNPAGRLPVTFCRSVEDLPPFTDYDMEGHTYRYFRGEPLYPFGYGLSYTQFAYTDLKIEPREPNPEQEIQVAVKVTNVGSHAGDEVVQLYVTDLEASVPVPIRELAGFSRIHLAPAQTKTVRFTIVPEQLSLISDEGERVIEAGDFQIAVGGCQPGFEALCGSSTQVLTGRVTVTGDRVLPAL
ncbi:MAG: glycoside hydrolase family 3 C-terminal domain-containing protein [Anaerolineae bacterium]